MKTDLDLVNELITCYIDHINDASCNLDKANKPEDLLDLKGYVESLLSNINTAQGILRAREVCEELYEEIERQ